MRNLQFGYGYLTEGGTASVQLGGTATGYDPANAVALGRDTSWKGSNTVAQRLVIHMGAAISPTFLGIAGGNYSSWGTTKLQHSTDGVTWTDYLTLSSLPSVNTDQDYRADFSALTPVSKAWWALSWAAPSAAPEVACFYLGTYVTLSKNDSYGGAEIDVYNVDRQRSEGAIIQAEETARRILRVDMAWRKIDSTLKETIRGVIQGEGGPLRPFWFVPIDESGSSTSGRAYLMRYEPLVTRMQRNFLNSYELGFSLLEEV